MSALQETELVELEAPVGQTRPHRPNARARTRKRIQGDWRQAFLQAYLDKGTIVAACEQVGVGRTTVYDRQKNDQEFADALRVVDEMVIESLEQEAVRRAFDGSDRLLEFVLKAKRPTVYSEPHRMIHEGRVDVRAELVVGSPEYQREMEAFAMPAAQAIAEGPEAVVPPVQQ